jgi:hypothetical protein
LREPPPPAVVQDKWEKVRLELEEHICQCTKDLFGHMPDSDVMIEVVLCMTGKKCSRYEIAEARNAIDADDSVVVEAMSAEDAVILKPTIWIHCGSEKCKKQVSMLPPKDVPY